MQFNGYDEAGAREYAKRWLPAWTGNQPELLVSFYTDDVFYSDPGVPQGVAGKRALLEYFTKLLARYPDWTWKQERAEPMRDGFVNYWRADIPEDGRTIVLRGVCLVQLHDGLIYRNEVFFDRSVWS